MVERFEPKTFPDFVQRMAARIVARTDLNDLEDGGVLMTIIGALARELDDLHYQMVRLQDVFDIDTAVGADLDARAKDYNPDSLTRLSAVRASGQVRFYRKSGGPLVTIPAGTVVAVQGDDDKKYQTAAQVVIAEDLTVSDDVLVTAIVPGESGNIGAPGYLDPVVLAGSADLTPDDLANGPTGISTIVTSLVGVDSVRNTTSITSGAGDETDSAFRTRIKAHLRSLSRATPFSLESAVLGVSLPNYGRIQVAKVVEQQEPNLGKVLLYVDDGTGSAATVTGHNFELDPITGLATQAAAEIIEANASGGELVYYTNHAPLAPANADPIVVWTTQTVLAGGPPVDTPTELVRGFAGSADGTFDYRLNDGSGKITLYAGGPSGIATEATSPNDAEGLQPLDQLTIRYSWYGGLLQEAQRIVDGDPTDRVKYPGIRAAGVDVRVLPPTILNQAIEATINIEPGYNQAAVLLQCKSEVMKYINGLNINGDIYITELVYAMQSVAGVRDIIWTSGGDPVTPTNVLVGEGELARIQLEDIILAGT